MNDSDTFEYYGTYIPDTFKPYINKYERVGKYVSEGKRIDILIVYLKKETSIERARTMQRNFIAGYLAGKYGSDKEKDAAVVAFVSPELDDWRFSLVKKEYKLTQTKSGKPKGEEEFTPARRYSFLVGKNEPNHTAQQQLLPILQDDVNNPTLEQLEKAFSVEKITKEFLSQYLSLYQKLNNTIETIVKNDNNVKEEFENKKIKTSDFSKKLLGQIVFLYFLQKKGWLGVPKDKNWGEGDRNFLRSLFKKCSEEKKNFFNDYLEVLFYNTLNNPRTNQADSTYSNYFDCKIPFLNGGLFEPVNNYDWQKKDLIIPNELFSNNEKTKEGDIGTGILDVFDRYNFTVQEDEPLEKEVALDPELLGKVFENLIEENLRKGQGAYYTPREIVHYMCQESLINYLATECEGKVKKEDIEILIKYGDITIEHDKLVIARIEENPEYNGKYKKIKMPESIKNNAKLIDEKLENIRVCDPAVGSGAFPVGMMLEIVKARNVLTNFLSNQEGRTSYNFKRHCIENCIYGVDIDSSAIDIAKLRFWLSLIVDEEDVTKIKPLPNLDYKLVCGNSLLGVEIDLFNSEAFKKLEELKPLYFNETDIVKKQELKNQINKLIKQITNNDEHFDYEVYFSEVFHEKKGFDVVIGNPPYVKKENLDKKIIRELEHLFIEFKNDKKTYWMDDLYVHFIFKGLEITKKNGIMTFITNDSFISLSSKERVRRLLLDNDLTQLIRCPRETFEAMIYTAVFLVRKCEAKNKQYESGYFEYPSFIYRKLGTVSYKLINSLPNLRLIFFNPIIHIYSKFDKSPRVKEYLYILDTGIHSGNVREKIFFKEKIKPKLDRLIQGRQINKYGIFWDSPDAKYKYCDIHYMSKKSKGIGRKGKDSKHEEYWHFCGDIENHHKPERLLMRQSDDDLVVAYHNKKDMGLFYTDNTVFTILPKNNSISLKYAMALFNSCLLNKFYHFLSQEEGKTLAQVKVKLVNELPFIVANQNSIIEIVDKILLLTSSNDYLNNKNKQNEVKKYSLQIDRLVYKIYNLTEEEIKIVEGRQ